MLAGGKEARLFSRRRDCSLGGDVGEEVHFTAGRNVQYVQDYQAIIDIGLVVRDEINLVHRGVAHVQQ